MMGEESSMNSIMPNLIPVKETSIESILSA